MKKKTVMRNKNSWKKSRLFFEKRHEIYTNQNHRHIHFSSNERWRKSLAKLEPLHERFEQ
jgi:hypothetical protein